MKSDAIYFQLCKCIRISQLAEIWTALPFKKLKKNLMHH